MTQSTSTAPADVILPRLIKIRGLIKAGKLKEAAQGLTEAQQVEPRDPRILLEGIRLAEAAGNGKGAIDTARKAVAMAPQWPPAVIELALVLARQNQFREAAEQAQKAVALAPDDLVLVSQAIDVAHRAGYALLALEFLPKAIALAAPKNEAFKRLMAHDLTAVGQANQALALFNELLQAQPDDLELLQGRAEAAARAGQPDVAQGDWDALVKLAPDNENYRFNQAVARGQMPATQPTSLPRALFDELSPIYDQHMVQNLGYQLPKQVADLVIEKFPDRKLNLLDLGCGTGLLGACLGPVQGYLIGVDVSEKMIALATRHSVYYRFHTVSVLEALESTPENLYEVIAALDVFIYVGDLTQAIPNAHRVTKPGGYFIFSCERALETEADLVLHPTKRYAHKQSHIEAQCKAAGFAQVTIQEKILRHENGTPIEGYLVIAQKGTA